MLRALTRARLSATATTVLLTLLALISLTSFIIPTTLDPASLKVSNLNVYASRSLLPGVGNAGALTPSPPQADGAVGLRQARGSRARLLQL